MQNIFKVEERWKVERELLLCESEIIKKFLGDIVFNAKCELIWNFVAWKRFNIFEENNWLKCAGRAQKMCKITVIWWGCILFKLTLINGLDHCYSDFLLSSLVQLWGITKKDDWKVWPPPGSSPQLIGVHSFYWQWSLRVEGVRCGGK